MLTRSTAEGAAAAAAAVVASAASVASEAARGWVSRMRAGRYTREGNGVLHRSHRRVSRFRPLLLSSQEWHQCGSGARVCASQGDTTRAPSIVPASRCLARNGGRGGDDRGSGSRGTLGRKTRQHSTQFSPRIKSAHLLHAKMSQIGTCLYARLVFHILIFSISTV